LHYEFILFYAIIGLCKPFQSTRNWGWNWWHQPTISNIWS